VAQKPTNLRVLAPSRKKIHRGDIFRMMTSGERCLFGRVVGTPNEVDAPFLGPAYFIYVYDLVSFSPQPPSLDALRPGGLLFSPLFTNRLPWSYGLFETLSSLGQSKSDVLERHCFIHRPSGRYFDEYGNELPEPVEPCGSLGLSSYRTIDDRVSRALGIPLVAPDDAEQ